MASFGVFTSLILLLLAVNGEAQGLDARATCFARLKQEILSPNYELTPGDHDDLNRAIQQVNDSPMKASRQPLLTWEVPKGAKYPVAITSRFYSVNDGNSKSVETTIGEDDDTRHLFILTLEVVTREGNTHFLSVKRQFNVDQNCMKQTVFTVVSEGILVGRRLTLSEQTFGVSGQAPSEKSSKTVELPTHSQFLIKVPEISTATEAKQFLTRFRGQTLLLALSSEIPLLKLQVKPITMTHFDPITGSSQPLEGLIDILQADGIQVEYAEAYSQVSGFGLKTDRRSEYWQLPFSEWSQGELMPLRTNISSHRQLYDPTQDPAVLSLASDKPLTLPTSLKAYWDLQSINSDRTRIELKARSDLDFSVARGRLNYTHTADLNPYLGSSQYVMTDLPQVRAFAVEARRKMPPNPDSYATALAIRQVLLSHFYYDYARLTLGSSLEDLPTSKLVKLGSGTCQNFSNLFAAIARSMGLPARIVVGLYISNDGVTNHAWNEFFDGQQWVPIEPEDLLPRFASVHYLPVAIETTDTITDPNVQSLFGQKFYLTVTQTQPGGAHPALKNGTR